MSSEHITVVNATTHVVVNSFEYTVIVCRHQPPCFVHTVPNRELLASSDSLSGKTTCSNRALLAVALPTMESNVRASSESHAVGAVLKV